MTIAKPTGLLVAQTKVQPVKRLSILLVNFAFVLLFVLLSPVYYLNKWDFKRRTRRNPFYTSKLVQLQGRYPLLYELAMYVQNFPIPRNVYKALPPLKGDVLQVGCGTGLLNKYARKNNHIRWINMDPNLNALRLGVKLGRYDSYIHAFIDKPTKLNDMCCDMIVFARSFHHIRNHKKALRECSRLLRYGGTIIIADPVVLEEKIGGSTGKGYMANSSIDGVIWRFTRETFVNHLKECLPYDLEIHSVTDTRQLHVTNYNLFVPQTDLIVVLNKKEG
ncbi:class I SAM-dependent methyltransferase [Paenibacillus prosopidis]|nr:class I SAM-dependent methyltransferase [Paenibacillus prosopidis]